MNVSNRDNILKEAKIGQIKKNVLWTDLEKKLDRSVGNFFVFDQDIFMNKTLMDNSHSYV